MNKKLLNYQTPECVYLEAISECILCSSQEDGSVIEDYNKLPGDWD